MITPIRAENKKPNVQRTEIMPAAINQPKGSLLCPVVWGGNPPLIREDGVEG